MKKKVFKTLFVFIIIIIVLIVLLEMAFFTDVYRMKKNMPVLFCTWGYSYSLPILGLTVTESGTQDLVKITTGILGMKYKYDIYYYGLKNVKVNFANATIDLKEALLKGEITMEDITGSMPGIISTEVYQDGGSKECIYENYKIIKMHNLNGNNNVYIGIPAMRIESVTSNI
ncbi:MAG: hypothetical protein FWF46_00800 [Oscillospiraceae bacterium]|nr:hypothetical protein [Oscillospiraceae bacterium]